MKKICNEYPFLKTLIKNIAAVFGNDCEVVLHDFTDGYEKTIVAIENGHVTGREIGDCPSNLFFEMYSTDHNKKLGTYYNKTIDGKILKSSTTIINDAEGHLMGSICINFDISKLILAGNAVQCLSGYKLEKGHQEMFVKNVSELLEYYLGECEKVVGKPPELMSKDDKMEAIKFLNQHGVFLISKSSIKVCDYLGISKFTLYSYLDEIRNKAK